MKVAAIIPAHNEEKHIRTVIEQTRNLVDLVIVIDDGSTDTTRQIVNSFSDKKVLLVRHRVNLGKGAALKTGCLVATKMGAEIVITIDSDGQHPTDQVLAMIKKLEADNLDIVFSARQDKGKMPLVRRAGNGLINFVARTFFNLNLRDLWCGLRAIRVSVLPQIYWTASDYSGEVQMALKAGQVGLRYGEHPIPTIYNDRLKGVTIFDGLKLLTLMFFWRIKL